MRLLSPRLLVLTALLLPALLATGCTRAANYRDPVGPRFAGARVPRPQAAEDLGALQVVSFNIQFARHVDRALALFDRTVELARADLVLLQEMDAPGVQALARHLGMAFVYYPATVHPQTQRDFGNAVLSRWPIVSDRKLTLPHESFLDGSQRTATCATVRTPLGDVEACSVHVATPVELLPGQRRDQVQAVLERLNGASPAVVGGDLNSHGLGDLFVASNFDWPTRDIGATARWFSVDHIFTRGLRTRSVGKVQSTGGASDHAAVWTRLVLRNPRTPAPQ